jgi:hypothetical protein
MTAVAVLVPLALLWPAAAGAELPRPYGATTGMYIEGAFGGNGITDDDYVDDLIAIDSDVDPLVGLAVAGYYRFIDWVSLGLVIHYAFLKPNVEIWTDDADHESSGFLGILAEVRGHLPVSRVDPWIGLGLGYAMTFSAAEGDASIFGDYEGHIILHGVGIGLSAGVNIFITEQLALGPYFRLIFGGWVSGCYEHTTDGPGPGGEDHVDECDDIEHLYEDDLLVDNPDDLPHLWVVGLDVNYTFD